MDEDNASEGKRFHVTASKSSYVEEAYDTAEEALAALTQFVADGYERVSISNEAIGIW